MTTTLAQAAENQITISEDIVVNASLDTTFASLLVQLGRQNETPDGRPLPMMLEAKPGGRWYRDLGGHNGHLWAFVQSIKRPVLLELWGPLFMSTAASNNLIYRLEEIDGGTRISFKHTMIGPIPDEFRQKMAPGWEAIHARVKRHAEAAKD